MKYTQYHIIFFHEENIGYFISILENKNQSQKLCTLSILMYRYTLCSMKSLTCGKKLVNVFIESANFIYNVYKNKNKKGHSKKKMV